MPMRAFSREQAYLLPPSLDDWVPADHSVRYVAEFVAALEPAVWAEMGIDLAGEETGAPAYHPELLLSVWLAGFMLGIRSSRKLEMACRDQISFRWLTGNQLPDHNTLWRFYRAHRAGMRRLLRLTVHTAQQAGLLDLTLLAVDGTKVAGNAARERTHDEEHLAELERTLRAAIAELEAENEGGEDERSARLPEQLRQAEALQARVQQALAAVRAENGPAKANTTDPETRLQQTRHGVVAGYNAQAAVVAVPFGPAVPDGLLMTAATVEAAQDDHQHLVPMLDASITALETAPDVVAADGGYHSGATLAACAEREHVVVMPETQSDATRADPYHGQHFRYDTTTDTYTCPQGETLEFRGLKAQTKRLPVRRYRVRGGGAVCRTCPAFGACTTDARQGRSLQVSQFDPQVRQHRAWMQTEEAQKLADRRKWLVEPAFGILKEHQNLRRFLLRGLENVAAEWSLLAVAFNLRTLVRAWRRQRILPGIDPQPTGKTAVSAPLPHTTMTNVIVRWLQLHIRQFWPRSVAQATT